MFNEVVFQESAKKILDEFGIKARQYDKGYYLSDSIETVSTICSKAVKAGLKIFNLLSAEDVMIRKKRVCGLVLNWTAVEMANLHVDPITMRAKFVVDATGHPAEVARIIEKKVINAKSRIHLTGKKFVINTVSINMPDAFNLA